MKSIKLWWICSGALVVLFGLSCLFDWIKNGPNPSNSAPYWVFLLSRAIVYLLPALICGCVAVVLTLRREKKTLNREDSRQK